MRIEPAPLAGKALCVWGHFPGKAAACVLVMFGLPAWAGQAAERVDPAAGAVLSNNVVRFEFEPSGMGLAAMVDLRDGRNHIRRQQGKQLLWQVAFARGTQVETITNNYRPCNYAALESLPDGARRLVMEWNDLRWWLENGVVTVRATVELPVDSGVARWRIQVENRSDYWGLWSVTYPLVSGFPAAGEYDLARPIFASGGRLLPEWNGKFQERYPSGSWPMQFLALSRGGGSVYLAGMDPDARAKDFVVESGQRTAIVHYPEDMGIAGSDYPDAYPVAFGVYRGGWVEAARRYRSWALNQKWASAGRLSRRPDVPAAIKDVALWVQDNWIWNEVEGTPQQMNAPLLDAQERLGVPVGLHWYNWHHMPFDNLYPHFLPPKPGFEERVKQLAGRGVLVMPYINGTSADMNIPDFDKFAGHAITDEAGGLRMHFYSDRAGRLLSMCPTQVFWQDVISKLVDTLIGVHGVNAVYVDQISAMSHELCFNKNHGHPAGGGRYWTDGNRDLLRKILTAAGRMGRGAVITSEAADEVFFDLVHANLTWAQPSEFEIPLMQMVYSGYTIFFGSPCNHRKSDQYFNYAQGQAFLDGRQNGWISLDLFRPEYAAKAEYFRQCGRYRAATKKFLTYGQLLGPIQPLNQVPVITDDGFGHAATVPGAEGRLWRSEDGHLGIFLANYANREAPFTYRLDPAQFGLKRDRFQLTELTPEGPSRLGAFTGPIERTEKLGAARIKVIEIE